MQWLAMNIRFCSVLRSQGRPEERFEWSVCACASALALCVRDGCVCPRDGCVCLCLCDGCVCLCVMGVCACMCVNVCGVSKGVCLTCHW